MRKSIDICSQLHIVTQILERRELQLAHQLHAVHAHERVHHDVAEGVRALRPELVLVAHDLVAAAVICIPVDLQFSVDY